MTGWRQRRHSVRGSTNLVVGGLVLVVLLGPLDVHGGQVSSWKRGNGNSIFQLSVKRHDHTIFGNFQLVQNSPVLAVYPDGQIVRHVGPVYALADGGHSMLAVERMRELNTFPIVNLRLLRRILKGGSERLKPFAKPGIDVPLAAMTGARRRDGIGTWGVSRALAEKELRRRSGKKSKYMPGAFTVIKHIFPDYVDLDRRALEDVANHIIHGERTRISRAPDGRRTTYENVIQDVGWPYALPIQVVTEAREIVSITPAATRLGYERGLGRQQLLEDAPQLLIANACRVQMLRRGARRDPKSASANLYRGYLKSLGLYLPLILPADIDELPSPHQREALRVVCQAHAAALAATNSEPGMVDLGTLDRHLKGNDVKHALAQALRRFPEMIDDFEIDSLALTHMLVNR